MATRSILVTGPPGAAARRPGRFTTVDGEHPCTLSPSTNTARRSAYTRTRSAVSASVAPHNFVLRSNSIKRYGPSSIPAGSAVADWPLTFDELESYYDKVDYIVGSSGYAGNIRGVPDPRGNAYEGPRSRQFPNPPLRRTGWSEALIPAAERLGWKYHDVTVCTNSRVYRGRPACSYCGFCAPIGCHSGAKGSIDVTAIPLAEATKNLKIIPEARAMAITTGNDGLATGVLYLKGGREFWQPASVVVLAAFTYENVRLLLLSKSNAYPNGLSNNHGVVGKYYTTHPGATTGAWYPGRKWNQFYGEGSVSFKPVQHDCVSRSAARP